MRIPARDSALESTLMFVLSRPRVYRGKRTKLRVFLQLPSIGFCNYSKASNPNASRNSPLWGAQFSRFEASCLSWEMDEIACFLSLRFIGVCNYSKTSNPNASRRRPLWGGTCLLCRYLVVVVLIARDEIKPHSRRAKTSLVWGMRGQN